MNSSDFTKRFSSLVDAIQENCQNSAANTAFTFVVDGESAEIHLTYGELHENARTIAARLQQLITPGDRAILLFPPGLDALPAFTGCLYAGVVIVPVIPPRPGQAPNDILRIIDDTTPSVILTNSQLEPFARKLQADQPELKIVAIDQLDSQLANSWSPPSLSKENLAILHFTSGSTKKPRGICFTHGNILQMLNDYIVRSSQLGLELAPQSTTVSWLPYYTGLGLIAGAIIPLLQDRHAIFFSPLDFSTKPVRWLRLMSRYQADSGGGPNFGYQLAMDRITPEECAGLDLSHWKIVFCGSEPVRPALLKAFAEKFAPYGLKGTFITGYGLSESMFAGASHIGPVTSISVDRQALQQGKVVEVAPDQPDSLTLCSNGQFSHSISARIINPETLADSTTDEIGELWFNGSNFPSGYWNQPEETKLVFQNYLPDGSGPYLRTGDLGFLKDNELYIAGRLKDLIILQGRNYWAQDFEQVAEKAHSALQAGSSAAFGVTVDDEEKLVLALELKPTANDPDTEEISRQVRLAIADEFQVPVHAVVLVAPNSIPRTSSGKIQRYQARLSYLAQV